MKKIIKSSNDKFFRRDNRDNHYNGEKKNNSGFKNRNHDNNVIDSNRKKFRKMSANTKDLSHIMCYNYNQTGHYSNSCFKSKRERQIIDEKSSKKFSNLINFLFADLNVHVKQNKFIHITTMIKIQKHDDARLHIALIDTKTTMNFIIQFLIKKIEFVFC